MADVADRAWRAAAKGYTALKTNIIWPGNPARRTQGRTGPHDQLATRDIIDQPWRIGVRGGRPEVDICLDVNVNFAQRRRCCRPRSSPSSSSGGRSTTRMPRRWSAAGGTRTPPCGGGSCRPCDSTGPSSSATRRTPYGGRLLAAGFSASKKVADLAETHEINVAPHNYNGHLSSFQALNFVASVGNVKIMESDPDAVPLRDELFTVCPRSRTAR
jgi:hypothetical protein